MTDVYKGTWNWIWQVRNVLNGDPVAIAAAAKKMGIDGVLIKIADGSLKDDPVSQSFMANFLQIIGPLKAAGLKVGAWIYQYLTDVDGEIDACVQAIEAGADWLVLDGEAEVYGKHVQVAEFGQKLRAKYPNITIGLSSFAIPDYHAQLPWQEYAAFVDLMMPQMYWATIGWDVAVTFHLSVSSYGKLGKPIAPTGQAYDAATAADMARFVALCKDAGYDHLSWWDWQHSTSDQLAAIGNNLIPAPKPPVKVANDVTDDRWSAPAIQYVMGNHIMVGDGQGNFNPEGPVTREMLAQALYASVHQPK